MISPTIPAKISEGMKTMTNTVARLLVALATAVATGYGTGFAATEWTAGPGHALNAVGALIVCLAFALATVMILTDVALDLHDARRLRVALGHQRHALDRMSAIG